MTAVSEVSLSRSESGGSVRLDRVVRTHLRGEVEVRAVDDVSLRLDAGSLAALVGPSGSGKTTLLQLIGGLDTPTSGAVEVAGQVLGDLDDRSLTEFRRTTVGFVFQFFNLLPGLSAWENVAMPSLLAGQRLGRLRPRAMELLDLVGLADRASHHPGELSGGQLQRVAIARALFLEPKIVLADEPTGNLDSTAAGEVLDLLVGLSVDGGRTVMIVTHDPRVAEATGVMIGLLDGRRVDA